MKGVAAAGDRRTAEAARDVLAGGGNAVDAAVAAGFTAFVAEPLLASAGGAGLMTVALPDAEPAVVDFFSTMPGLGGRPARLDFHNVEIDFGSTTQTFHVGRGSVAPPGALPGLIEAARRFGTRPLTELVERAVGFARAGLPLSAENAAVFSLLWPIQRRSEEAVALAGGRPPAAGDAFENPALADLLEEAARLEATPDRFRRALLDAFGVDAGGLLSEQDLARAAPRVREARHVDLGRWTIVTSPHVGGGRVARMVAQLAEHPPEPVEALEALRVARACRAASARVPDGRGSTTHISVLDAHGGAASVTLTNGEGCGHVAPGTGVQPNNFLGEDDLNPDGFHRHVAGDVLPTMIAPTIGLERGRPVIALGSGGSNRIRSVVSQVLYRVMRGETVEHAVLAPRIHAEADDVWIEDVDWAGFDAIEAELSEEFARVHPFPDRAFYFGGVHAVLVDANGAAHAAGDPRRGGAVARVE